VSLPRRRRRVNGNTTNSLTAAKIDAQYTGCKCSSTECAGKPVKGVSTNTTTTTAAVNCEWWSCWDAKK
jgi:hypothetical protein